MTRNPHDWCDPPEAFGRLKDKDDDPVTSRRWKWEDVNGRADVLFEYRCAVRQSVICLHIRKAKNKRPHPEIGKQPRLKSDATFPLSSLADLDPRHGTLHSWQAKMSGRRALTLFDIEFLKDEFGPDFPSEAVIQDFLDVAEHRVKRPAAWGTTLPDWPDT